MHEEKWSEEKIEEYRSKYKFQPELTQKLDGCAGLFTQETINEIVLWKVNRYAQLKPDTLALINAIPESGNVYDESKKKDVINALLAEHGVRLPMASTILRFRNPEIFQIIDQRVYRYLYNKLMPKTVSQQTADLYLQYLQDLQIFCEKIGMNFIESDRLLYVADKIDNKDKPLR